LFTDLPLSQKSKEGIVYSLVLWLIEGLKKAHFTTLTDIQRKALPLALKGKDILGAAKTGSGKTLAFIIPVPQLNFIQLMTGTGYTTA